MTFTTPPEEAILQTDTLGRIRTSFERREKILDEFERSGLSAPKFAELTGVKYQTLATWLQKRRKTGKPDPSSSLPSDPMQWLEAVVGQAQPNSSFKVLTLHLPDGIRFEISDLAQVQAAAALIRALRPSC